MELNYNVFTVYLSSRCAGLSTSACGSRANRAGLDEPDMTVELLNIFNRPRKTLHQVQLWLLPKQQLTAPAAMISVSFQRPHMTTTFNVNVSSYSQLSTNS